MLYVKYKELTKTFNFSNALNREDLPGYIKHYILDDEQVLVVYKTERDHGVFTDKKIVLFDSYKKRKQIYAIPYKSISTISILFDDDYAILDLFLNSGYPETLKFVNLTAEEKLRLRILYTCVNRLINDQEPLKMDMDRLLNNDISLSNKK